MLSDKPYKIFLWVILMLMSAGTVKAEAIINIAVKTVLASQENSYRDPRLMDLVEELQSVFRYTSYRLLSQDRMSLRPGNTGSVNLPDDRVLTITLQGIRENRAELKLVILKRNQLVFRTTIRLRNRSSITVGGPQHKKGYLLFNISNSF